MNSAKALLILFAVLLMASCDRPAHTGADGFNDTAYAWHYRDLDSTEHYARLAMAASASYADGHAEALNHLAFVSLVRMDYDRARRQLDSVAMTTANQIELLVASVQRMRLCQRRSANREFYDCREQAQQCLRRINEDRGSLNDRQLARLLYAETEMAIVTSTYYYYVGLERQSSETMLAIASLVERDTAQLMNYLYNVGAGGIIVKGAQAEINQQEFDCLMRCFLLAQHTGSVFFTANAMEAIAEHIINPAYRAQLMADNLPAMKYVNPENVADDLLPIWLSERALALFQEYGDIYQTAGAFRTLASCHLALDDYESALFCLERSLGDSAILQAPDLVASIREQLSVAYAATDNKAESDRNRNLYLDLQEQTRQDRQLEARAGQMEQALRQTERLLWAVVAALAVLIVLILGFHFRQTRQKEKPDPRLQEQIEELQEQTAMMRLNVEKGERRHVEQRAKVAIATAIIPLIDRILHAINHQAAQTAPETSPSQLSMDYVCELTDEINRQNELLTHWIQLRQGELSLRIETFPLQELFDMVGRSERSFAIKGLTLNVRPTEARVKADRVLTLFMLNTLADNARKFTSEGGSVSIEATEGDDYVQISVADTGHGMDEEQLASLFTTHPLSSPTHSSPLTPEAGHGFGLLNCKGIIEKYRKTSSLFSVCQLKAESRVGEGSRLSFRLPKGSVARNAGAGSVALIGLLTLLAAETGVAKTAPTPQPAQVCCDSAAAASNLYDNLSRAAIYADSAYFSNINGTYERTLLFADSCRHFLNEHYRCLRPNAADTMLCMGDLSTTPSEISWLRDSIDTNFDLILDIRNESAVAALALHQWALYQYNNRIYTYLFKERSADTTLDDYCRKMQQSQTNRQVAIIMLVMLFLVILAAVAWQLMQAMKRSANRRQKQQDQLDMMGDELLRLTLEGNALHVSNAVLDNTLSALKHETMYYPSRIAQLVHGTQPAQEVVAYYRELYGLFCDQAMHQVETVRLHLKPLGHDILGDENLIRYLFDIIKKENGQTVPDIGYIPRDGRYVECRVKMAALRRTDLFTPSQEANIPWLICRQIVRDHGEATNRRACAIRAEAEADGRTVIVITLPSVQHH